MTPGTRVHTRGPYGLEGTVVGAQPHDIGPRVLVRWDTGEEGIPMAAELVQRPTAHPDWVWSPARQEYGPP